MTYTFSFKGKTDKDTGLRTVTAVIYKDSHLLCMGFSNQSPKDSGDKFIGQQVAVKRALIFFIPDRDERQRIWEAFFDSSALTRKHKIRKNITFSNRL